MIVNGPYARRIGLTGGRGCFGPGFQANATIGRALRLLLLNLGGGIPRVASMSTFSQPSRFTFCAAENEEESPWDSLAVSRGYPSNDNVITMIMCENPQIVFNDVDRDPRRLLISVADYIGALGSWPTWTRTDVVVALSPEHARISSAADFSRDDVHRYLREVSGRTVRGLKRGGSWRDGRPSGRWPYPVDRGDDDFFVRAINDPQDRHLLVAGGNSPLSAVMPGRNGASRSMTRIYQT